MGKPIQFRGILQKETDLAREIKPTRGAMAMWIPKSVFLYYRRDPAPQGVEPEVTFSLEGWKEREVSQNGRFQEL
jgi:hypothetical protein